MYFACTSDSGQPYANWPIAVDPAVTWEPLADDARDYQKEWFDDCGEVKVFLEERIVMGSYYGKVVSPVFFITDIPGAQGHYLLKKESVSN